MDAKTYVPVDSELYDDICVCCEESHVNPDDVVNYSLRFILNNYIQNRNKRYAELSLGELSEIYPEVNDEGILTIKSLAKEDKLGVIRLAPSDDEDEYIEYHESNNTDKMCESCKKLARRERISDYEVFGPVEPVSREMVKVNDSPEAVLPMLSELINTAHSVNISINVLADE